MGLIDPGYERGWQRFGFTTLDFAPSRVHAGAYDVDVAVAIDRGVGRPFVAFVVVPPGHDAAFGLHVHRSAALGRDVEEWYVIVEGTGVQRFSNGDEVAFGPGDLIAAYPGTAHSLAVSGDQPVKMLGIIPELFQTVHPDAPAWPESWAPRVRVLATTEDLNPTAAECTACGTTWARPDDDPGAHTLADWAADHGCAPRA